MAYASTTTVAPEKTQGEIRKLLERSKAEGVAVAELWGDAPSATVQFRMRDRMLRFKISLTGKSFWSEKQKAQFVRTRWRALLLTIKAKLESVEAKIEMFDEAFLAQVVMPDGRTVADHALPGIQSAYEGNPVPLLTFGG